MASTWANPKTRNVLSRRAANLLVPDALHEIANKAARLACQYRHAKLPAHFLAYQLVLEEHGNNELMVRTVRPFLKKTGLVLTPPFDKLGPPDTVSHDCKMVAEPVLLAVFNRAVRLHENFGQLGNELNPLAIIGALGDSSIRSDERKDVGITLDQVVDYLKFK